MTRRLVAAVATAAALASGALAAPASAQLCQLVEDCTCRLLRVGCIEVDPPEPARHCFDTGDIRFCV